MGWNMIWNFLNSAHNSCNSNKTESNDSPADDDTYCSLIGTYHPIHPLHPLAQALYNLFLVFADSDILTMAFCPQRHLLFTYFRPVPTL
jgi:hypothetical protein